MMMRSTTLFFVATMMACANAWTTTTAGSSVSSFGGSVLLTAPAPSTSTCASSRASTLEMKKGKPNVPPGMRGDYRRQKEMSQMREQMINAQSPGKDGLPVFNLYVRTKKANMWYPCGSFKGDEKSKALAQSWSDGGMMAGISKKQLDGGIAGSLAQDIEKLKDSVCRAYPQLRKSRAEFEWGYKLSFPGLPEEKAKSVELVEPREQKGVLDGVKNLFR